MNRSCFDPARPPNQERCPQGTLEGGEIGTSSGTGCAVVRVDFLRAVLAHPDDDRVVTDAESVDGVKDLSSPVIQLGEHVCPTTVPGDAVEVRVIKVIDRSTTPVDFDGSNQSEATSS